MRDALAAMIGLLMVTQGIPGFEAGEKVVVVTPVEMTTKTGAPVVLTPGSTVTVQAVEDQRLKVAVGKVGWIDAGPVIRSAEADAHFSKRIGDNPRDAVALKARGKFRFERGDHDRAIADLDRTLTIAPDSEALTIRGFAWKRKGDKDKAMADLDEAIRLNPRNALAWRVRGATWAGKADYPRALADYSESLRIDPENPETLHHRAGLLSICPDAQVRDGKQAVEDATNACALTDWKVPLFFNGLATAYAEKGDFDSAIRWQIRTIEASSKDQAKSMQHRLEQFRRHEPFRMTWK